MVELFSLKSKARVLDPCFGHGVFVKSLLDKTDFHVDGIEIDEKSFALFENPDIDRCSLKRGDFFDIEENYDGIIMNPPYVRQEELDNLQPLGISKQKLQSSCGLMTISTKANLYMYFVFRAIILLRDKGELIAIFPNSWTNTPVGKCFYEQMCHYGSITDFINVDGEAFEGSPMVDVCILKYVKGLTDETIYKQMTISKLGDLSVSITERKETYGPNKLVKLQSIARVRRGITTGFNKIFINPPIFTKDHIVKILSSPKDITGYSTAICRQDDLLAIQCGDIFNDEEAAYLENCANIIRKEGKPRTLKVLIEKGQPWYNISIPDNAQIIFSYIVRRNLKFVLNEGGCNVRDNFYMISSDYSPLLILALLNNYHVFCQLEHSGKSYGKGLLKIQRYDIADIKLPHPSSIREEDKNKLIELSDNLVKTSDESNVDSITNILAQYYGEPDAKNIFTKQKLKRLTKL